MSDWSSWGCGDCGNDPCSCSILTPGHGHFDGPFSRSGKTDRQRLEEENERLRKEVARLKKKLKQK
jgi:hypothetical protein